MSEEFHYGDAIACLGDPDTWTDPGALRRWTDLRRVKHPNDSDLASYVYATLSTRERSWHTALRRLTGRTLTNETERTREIASALYHLHRQGLPVDTIAALRAHARIDHLGFPHLPVGLAAVAVVAGLTPTEAINGVYRHRGESLAEWVFLTELTRPGILNALTHEQGLDITAGARGT